MGCNRYKQFRWADLAIVLTCVIGRLGEEQDRASWAAIAAQCARIVLAAVQLFIKLLEQARVHLEVHVVRALKRITISYESTRIEMTEQRSAHRFFEGLLRDRVFSGVYRDEVGGPVQRRHLVQLDDHSDLGVGETVILLTLPLHPYIEAPTKGRGGCGRMTVSPTTSARTMPAWIMLLCAR